MAERLTSADYATLADKLPQSVVHDLLALGRGAKPRLHNFDPDLATRRGLKYTLTSRAHLLREALIRKQKRPA